MSFSQRRLGFTEHGTYRRLNNNTMEEVNKMKKRILGSICAVMLALACYAMPAFAATQDPSISGPGTVNEGDTITVTVTTWAEALAGNVSVKGLEVLGVSGSTLSTEKSVLIVTRVGGNSARYECKVTAGPGETVSFSVLNAVESSSEEEYNVTLSPWTEQVKQTVAPATPTPVPPTEEPTVSREPEPTVSESPSEEPSPSQSTPTGGTGAGGTTGTGGSPGTGSGNASGGSEKLPKTADSNVDGWIVLLIGIASAGLAIVAGRQVLVHRRQH